jgi:hypothetical protein
MLDDQVSYSVGKRICFASPRSRDDEQRLIIAVLRSPALFGIKRFIALGPNHYNDNKLPFA